MVLWVSRSAPWRAWRDHGRVEERTCLLSHDLSWVENRDHWKGLAGVALVRAERHELASGTSSAEERLFILSDPTVTAAAFLLRHVGLNLLRAVARGRAGLALKLVDHLAGRRPRR